MGDGLRSFADPLLLAVSLLAVYRLTRLVVSDEILAAPRARLVERGGRLSYFVTCPWCVSIWLAGGWALLLWLAPSVALVLGFVLAASAVAGLLSSWE